MKNNKIRVSAIFFSLTICLILILTIDIFGDTVYQKRTPLDYALYWTNWSVFASWIWISLLFVMVHKNNEKMLLLLNSWHSKGVVTAFVITAGIVVMVAFFFIIFYALFNFSNFKESLKSFSLETIVGTITKHLIIQVIISIEFIFGFRLNKDSKIEKDREKIMLSLFLPNIYFIFVILSISQGAHPPYFVFGFAEKTLKQNSYLFQWFSLISCFFIAVIFTSIFKTILVLNVGLESKKIGNEINTICLK